MIVVLIVVIWVAVLSVMGFRRLSERQADTSVNRFRLQTRTLRRVQPQAAGVEISDQIAVNSPQRVARTQNGGPSRSRTAELRARRKRTLTILVGSVAGTFIFGAIPPLRFLWDLTIVAVVATCIYVALLVKLNKAALASAALAERNRKVVPLRLMPPAENYEEQLVAQGGGSAFMPARSGFLPTRPSFILVEAPSS